ncbi:non-heme iron oxygenase ferredoxin subunit [Rugosimonospora acidiphila]|uniref:Non-heme iron oxygenase ferredoxin subunit n=1 Tax=Rugosimonospora acidiphila TaxID=556531 RepID=A0ABP9S257_9ACTN
MGDNWVSACPREALRSGEMTMEELSGNEIVLADVDGEVFAFDGICTHALGYLDQGDLDGYQVLCPLHEGRFDIRTGKVVAGEPDEPIAVYPTKVQDGTVYVNVPE